jgi:hypothetical protein
VQTALLIFDWGLVVEALTGVLGTADSLSIICFLPCLGGFSIYIYWTLAGKVSSIKKSRQQMTHAFTVVYCPQDHSASLLFLLLDNFNSYPW